MIRSILDKPLFDLDGDVVGLTVEASCVPGEAVGNVGVVEEELWPVTVTGTVTEVAVAGPMKLQKDANVLTASIPALEKEQVAARLII